MLLELHKCKKPSRPEIYKDIATGNILALSFSGLLPWLTTGCNGVVEVENPKHMLPVSHSERTSHSVLSVSCYLQQTGSLPFDNFLPVE